MENPCTSWQKSWRGSCTLSSPVRTLTRGLRPCERWKTKPHAQRRWGYQDNTLKCLKWSSFLDATQGNPKMIACNFRTTCHMSILNGLRGDLITKKIDQPASKSTWCTKPYGHLWAPDLVVSWGYSVVPISITSCKSSSSRDSHPEFTRTHREGGLPRVHCHQLAGSAHSI